MKISACLLALLLPLPAFAAEATSTIDVVVNGIPATASEIVVVVDTVAPMATPSYDEPAAPPAAPATPAPQAVADLVQAAAPAPAVGAAPAAPAQPAGDPAAAGQRRRGRRGGAGGAGFGAAPATPPFRQAVATAGATTVTAHIARPAGDNYRVRAIAIGQDGSLPAVLAGGQAAGIKLTAEKAAPVALDLKSPALKLSPDNPTSVAAGSKFTLAGKITDAARSLGAKNRMRVWISENTPPDKNRAGTQISTVEVTAKDDDVDFAFSLTAPKNPGTLYFQFGEIPPDFARDDGTQAPLLVLPDLRAGGSVPQLKIEAAPAKLGKL